MIRSANCKQGREADSAYHWTGRYCHGDWRCAIGWTTPRRRPQEMKQHVGRRSRSRPNYCRDRYRLAMALSAMSLAAISAAQVPRSRGCKERKAASEGVAWQVLWVQRFQERVRARESTPTPCSAAVHCSSLFALHDTHHHNKQHLPPLTPVHAPPHESTAQSSPSDFTTERVPKATTPGDPRAASKVSLTCEKERAHWRSRRAAQAPTDCRRAISPLHGRCQQGTTTVQARPRSAHPSYSRRAT